MTAIKTQVMASIAPQLKALETLFDQYAPEQIGKHHHLYDSPLGRAHHYRRTRSHGGFHIAYISPEFLEPQD